MVVSAGSERALDQRFLLTACRQKTRRLIDCCHWLIILKAMDTIFICGERPSLVPNATVSYKCSKLSASSPTTLHGDANLTEDTHCCWTMWSERSLMEAESLWSGGCQPAPLWSEAAQPVLRGGLQHMEGEHRKDEFRRWDFTLRMLDFFLPPFGTKLRILTYQNTTFYQHHDKKRLLISLPDTLPLSRCVCLCVSIFCRCDSGCPLNPLWRCWVISTAEFIYSLPTSEKIPAAKPRNEDVL